MWITGSRHSDMHAQPKTPSFSLLNPHLVIHAIVSPARDNIHILPHFQFLLMIVNDNFLRRCGPRCAGIDMSHCIMLVPCMRHSCMNSVWTRCMHARGEGGGECVYTFVIMLLFDLRVWSATGWSYINEGYKRPILSVCGDILPSDRLNLNRCVSYEDDTWVKGQMSLASSPYCAEPITVLSAPSMFITRARSILSDRLLISY